MNAAAPCRGGIGISHIAQLGNDLSSLEASPRLATLASDRLCVCLSIV